MATSHLRLFVRFAAQTDTGLIYQSCCPTTNTADLAGRGWRRKKEIMLFSNSEKSQHSSSILTTQKALEQKNTSLQWTSSSMTGRITGALVPSWLSSLHTKQRRQLSFTSYSNMSAPFSYQLSTPTVCSFYCPLLILIVIPHHCYPGPIPSLPSFAKDLCFHPWEKL